ncbi:hypothetical protein ACI68E_004166 [Malassezia pachydermatis]|uniref:DUF3835 domain-containing protein n=1 Tax=Malassezia pachydermatis TaxID=77020 RepID=A0A0M8MND8_9BASI|nr:hypothetical protein Malapachy_2031 [Malassezia pachydermatis]KOS13597.1 hypothetical protein Malapachy_2031 [Malassezia pachydermatis]
MTHTEAAQAAPDDAIVLARACLERLRALRTLKATPAPWDTTSLHPEDRAALTTSTSHTEALAKVNTQIRQLEQRMDELKHAFSAQMRQSFESSLRGVFQGDGAENGTELTDENQVLNEEGLPFVDPLEALPDSPPQTPDLSGHGLPRPTGNVLGRTPGHVEPFDPTLQGEERRQWMSSVFDELEQEEAAERQAEEAAAAEAQKAKSPLTLRRGFLQNAAATQAQDTTQRTKKHVRIVEPSEETTTNVEAPATKRKAVPLGMDPEDAGVQEEAARIVELLGPEVIRGHPNAERIFADMEASQPRIVQKVVPDDEEHATPAGPAVKDTIEERSTAEPTTIRTPGKRKASAFKQRQRAMKAEDEARPSAPSISHGISAIERAGRKDDAQASQLQGARIPHARPTKAYAEKLAQRAAARDVDNDEEEAAPARPRRVRFGGDEVFPTDTETAYEAEERMEEDEDAHVVHRDEDDENEEAAWDETYMAMDDDDEGDVDTWQDDDDALWDSDDDYTPTDVEALKPAMQGHPDDAYWNDDLARAYAEAKARLASTPSSVAEDPHDDNAETYGIAPLSASVGDDGHPTSQPHVSRFKAARMKGEAVPDPNGDLVPDQRRGHDTDDDVQRGPIMVLPSLAPVRFPRPVDDSEGGGIDLDGESDEDDERLHALMRARLSVEESTAPPPPPRTQRAPPTVGAASRS